MERSLFAFIWKHSKRDQLILLAVTVFTFPLLYATLELPKRIINDAIGSASGIVTAFGYDLTQIQFLMLLCFGFLLAVLCHGLLKMRLNTMKGVLAERMLRRFRFLLLHRMMRFPKPYFRTTSQGELVSMVTAEAEPMGGLMGDALSQPVFQAGQMATILFFLFAQSFWFGLAAIALIPLQAWLIPKLQRQINLLNKERIKEVRAFAAEIGETAQGASELRINGGLRWRGAVMADRLGRLFGIRFQIYQKKFFMKFLNNFINQLTPFFFYSVGGILAIQGQITVGALVAALAAYKDLSSPWKELLAYYNQTQDMSLRWEVVTERFAPEPVVDAALYDGEPEDYPHLNGETVFKNVTVRDEDGNEVLEDINLTIPAGGRVAVQTSSPAAGAALAQLLTREVLPTRGEITVGGQPLNSLHQNVISRRIGYAHSEPYAFQGTLGGNIAMPLRGVPVPNDDVETKQWIENAIKSGNPPDPISAAWVSPKVAGFETMEEVRDWWFELITAMGADEFMVRRTLRSVIAPDTQPDLEKRIVALRPVIAQRLEEAGLLDVVHRFHPDKFNPVSLLGSNLLYALPAQFLGQQKLATQTNFVNSMKEEGIDGPVLDIASSVIDTLDATFGADGTDHELFSMLNLEEDLYFSLSKINAKRRMGGDDTLSDEELGLLMTVPFTFTAEKIGPAFREEYKETVLQVRKRSADKLVAALDGLFMKIEEDRYFPIMSVLGNAIYGRISAVAGGREQEVIDLVVDVIREHDLQRDVAQSIFWLETSIGADNLPKVFRERMAFSRAAIKRPDVFILHNALSSYNAENRSKLRSRLRDLMPNTTKVFIEKEFNNPSDYDLFVEIKDGRIDGGTRSEVIDEDAKSDLGMKLSAISQAELFAGLDRKNQRLLAFSAQWYKAPAGTVVFSQGQPPDAAYLCVKGLAALYFPDREVRAEPVTEVPPGRLIGDLAIILNQNRVLDMETLEDSVFLRIGKKELDAVINSDVKVAASLLRSVAGHLSNTSDILRQLSEQREVIEALRDGSVKLELNEDA
ncbi:MAG: cyclic nucleotide-binding domain-containing protein [Pseudomonadota bacterium]